MRAAICVSALLAAFSTAQAAVPTFDVSLNPKWDRYFTQGLYQKEIIDDPRVRQSAQDTLREVYKRIIEFVGNGGVGEDGNPRSGPLFIENTRDYLRRAEQRAADDYLGDVFRQPNNGASTVSALTSEGLPGLINSLADPNGDISNFLCSPFQFPLSEILRTRLADRPIASFPLHSSACSFGSIVMNVLDPDLPGTAGTRLEQEAENFLDRFFVTAPSSDGASRSEYGWIELLALADPINNPYFLFADTVDRINARKQEAREVATIEALQSGGVLPLRERGCADPTGLNCAIVTPSPAIAELLSVVTSSEIRALEATDELDEIFATSVDQLVSWTITGDREGKGLREIAIDAIRDLFNFEDEDRRYQRQASTQSILLATEVLNAAVAEEARYRALKYESAEKLTQLIGALDALAASEHLSSCVVDDIVRALPIPQTAFQQERTDAFIERERITSRERLTATTTVTHADKGVRRGDIPESETVSQRLEALRPDIARASSNPALLSDIMNNISALRGIHTESDAQVQRDAVSALLEKRAKDNESCRDFNAFQQ